LPGTSGWSSTFDGVPTVMLNPPMPDGSLQVTITPAAAITAGAQWQVDGGISQPSGATVLGLSVDNHTVSFSPISGWVTPVSQTVMVIPNQTTMAAATYIALLPPSITVEPISQSVGVGGSGTFSVTAAGIAPFSYAWYRNSTSIAAGTNSSYTATNVQLTDSGSQFFCVISNAYGSVTSSIATLTVGLPPSISQEPTNVGVLQGGIATFSVGVSGTGPYSYQWQLNGTNLPNGIITTVAGNGYDAGTGYGGCSGDWGPATNAELWSPEGVAVDATGNLFIADTLNERIRKVGTNETITTVAGNGAGLRWPEAVAVDASGNLFIADYLNNRVCKLGTNWSITTVAGNGYGAGTGYGGYSGDGGAATSAELWDPIGVAVDATGNLFIADSYNNRVREVGTDGIITTVAGNGPEGYGGYSGDGGAGTNAELWSPEGVAVDVTGNLFIADSFNNVIRKVDTNGIITTVAGNGYGPGIGYGGYSGDGGAATNAELSVPIGVAVDATGNLFIADSYNNVIRKVDTNGIITTVAGNGYGAVTGYGGYSGDGGAATNAELGSCPSGVAVDATGNLFIADQNNNVIRKVVLPLGPTLLLNDVDFRNAGAYDVVVSSPYGSVTSSVANLTITLPPLVTAEPISQSIAVGGSVTFSVTSSGTAPFSYAWYRNSASIATATNSSYTSINVQLPDSGSQFVCVISNAYGSVTSSIATLTVWLPPSINPEPTNVSVLLGGTAIFSVGVSGTGPFSYQWQLNGTNLPNGIITTVAGDGNAAYSGDGGPATNASLYSPTAVALEASDSLLIADEQNNVIRKVTANGIITTEAGNGSAGYSGDGGPATNASLYWPDGVTVDAAGNLFIADSANNVIRKVGTNGIITTVAGNGSADYSGDGGQATNASLSYPEGVALDSSGNLLIADWVNNVIRKVDTNGIITTVAGNGSAGYSGDGGPATNASLNGPYSAAFGTLGSLFISDTDNQRIREVDTNGVITTVAGNGSAGHSGDGGMATNASLCYPAGVALDIYGSLFIADEQNNVIRKVGTNGIITTLAGNGSAGYSGDGGAATNASLSGPYGLALDICGNLFVADTFNNRVRELMLFASYPTLMLNNVTLNNAGIYTVITSNPYESVTSSVATLTVTLPAPNVLTFWTTNGLLKFTWAGVPNQTYLVQYTTDLNSANWLSLGSPITATNGTASASDFIGPDQKRFYRVVLLLSP
jgi:hypothetical protein